MRAPTWLDDVLESPERLRRVASALDSALAVV
jgi:hypothetical protein